MTVQLAPTERKQLETAAAREGKALSDYVRQLCLRRGGRTPVVAGTRRNPDAKALADELRAIGNNINQLARVANQTGELRREAELDDGHRPSGGDHRPGDPPVIARSVVGKGVTGLSKYVLGEGRGAGNDNLAPGEETRVAWIGGQNFGFAINSRERARTGHAGSWSSMRSTRAAAPSGAKRMRCI